LPSVVHDSGGLKVPSIEKAIVIGVPTEAFAGFPWEDANSVAPAIVWMPNTATPTKADLSTVASGEAITISLLNGISFNAGVRCSSAITIVEGTLSQHRRRRRQRGIFMAGCVVG